VTPLYLAYLTATIVLVLSPGATTAVVVKNTLAGGHRAGVQAAFGAALANVTHATLAGLGLWVLVGRWPLVLDALRLGGAAYLAWLGLRSLARLWPRPSEARASAAAETPHATSSHQRPGGRPSFVEGLAVNILNPAIVSFYLAVVPTFMPPAPPRHYFAVLAATHVGLAFACHAGWATAFHALRQVFARPPVRVALELATAVAMLWLAARVLASR
jgi:threonine/homoserine/homoserine lactone efflux protein